MYQLIKIDTMKIKYLFSIITAVLLLSCSKEEIPQIEQGLTDGTYKLVLNVSHSQYEGNTKADYQWPDGATLYIKFPDASSTTTATYNSTSKEWSITTPQGKLTQNKEAECHVSYFEKSPVGDIIELDENDVVYYDGSAKYNLKADTLSITANLSPKDGRLRFKGEPGSTIKLYGIGHNTMFNTFEGNYYGEYEELELIVNSDGYTRHIHAYFPFSQKRLEITDIDNNIFVFKCSDEHLAPGSNGYFSIPTVENPGSWKIHAPIRTFKVDGSDEELKMIFVQYISGSFYLAETETTQRFYNAVMNNNPSHYKSDTEELPVENVSIGNMDNFISTLSDKTGYPFTYPTITQWRHAARGGNKSKGYKFSGSDDLNSVAWYSENSKTTSGSWYDKYTNPVKTKNPNELGLYDMSGNVRETCYNDSESGGVSYYELGGSCYERCEDQLSYFITNRNDFQKSQFSKDQYTGFRLCLNI